MSFLVAAYAVLWAGVFGYLLWLAGRVRSLRDEARSLAEGVEPGESPQPLESPARR